MSVNLNDPEIGRIRGELLDPSSATSWFICHYNPSSTSPALQVVASGHNPIIEKWKEQLVELQGNGDAVAFGYGEFEGKGCILLCLNDTVAGVKRARAVVHSRAFAQLFPDYSALITISSPDQLNDALIKERLGLDYYQQRNLQPATSSLDTSRADAPAQTSIQKEVLPPLPSSLTLAEPISTGSSPSTTTTPSQPSTFMPVAPAHRQVSAQAPATTSDRQVSGPNLAQHVQDPDVTRHIRQASGAGPESSPEVTNDRHRKTSLTARLGKAFGNPAMQSRPSESPSEGSPSSASGSSRIKSSFTKAFKRRSGGTSPQHSPRADAHDAPPVPPKDDYPARPTRQSDESPFGTYRTPSGGVGYAPNVQKAMPRENSSGPAPSAGTFPEAVSRLYPAQSNDNHLSPSPSAKRIMTEARIKSVSKEEEIQNRFRRDLHLDDRGAGDKELVDDEEDDDIGLPYDTSDHSVSNHLTSHEPVETIDTSNTGGPSMQIPRKPVDYGVADSDQTTADRGLPHQSEPTVDASSNAATSDRQVVPEAVVSQVIGEYEEPTPATGLENDPSILLSQGRQTEAQEPQVDPAEVERQRQADDLAQLVEAQRLEQLRQQERHEAEDRERAAAAAELQRHAEEYALQKEAERQREQEAQAIRDAEARRVQEEAERQKKEEEEEKLRLVLEEQHRMEQVRLVEEETRRREEEERRIEAEKQEAERARKEGIKQTLREGKQSGGVMLRGHVTVQTMKSPIWRRRYFQLLSGQMQLYKNEPDDKPIQTIPLGQGVRIEHTYEESQVQGSWKIVSGPQHGEEEYFVFADSPEEKETILEGLQIAMA